MQRRLTHPLRSGALALALLLASGVASAAGTTTAPNYAGLRAALDALFATDLRLAATALRLTFHASGTYQSATGQGGSQCPVDLTAPANSGLQTVVPTFAALAQQFGTSKADAYTLAGVRAVAALAGPTIPWRAGRQDLPCLTLPGAGVTLPSATTDGFAGAPTPNNQPPTAAQFAPNKVRSKMAAMGLTDTEIVTLIGAHTVGFAHYNNSGFAGAWTATPMLFSNAFFVNFATSPPNDLTSGANGVSHFFGAWRANALNSPVAGPATQFRNGVFGPTTGSEAGLVPTSNVTSTSYVQPSPPTNNGNPLPPGGDYIRLPTDMALLADASFLSTVQAYAAGFPAVGTSAKPTAGSTAFFTAFAAAMQKIAELGVPAAQLFTPSLVASPPPPSPSPPPVKSPPPPPPVKSPSPPPPSPVPPKPSPPPPPPSPQPPVQQQKPQPQPQPQPQPKPQPQVGGSGGKAPGGRKRRAMQ